MFDALGTIAPPIFTGVTALTLAAQPSDFDSFLAALSGAGESNGTLVLTGLAAPGAVGMAALAVLLVRSWTVTRDWPIITADTRLVINVDGTWKLQVDSDGAAPTYQWQSYDGANWNDIGGQVSDTYNNPPPAVSGATTEAYRCKITDAGEDVYSSRVAVAAPALNGDPLAGGEAHYGQSDLILTFIASSDGEALDLPVNFVPEGSTYQWRKDGVNIDGASGTFTGADITYTPAGPTSADAGDYDLVITAPCGAYLTTAAATWTVVDPAILTQPAYEDVGYTLAGISAAGAGTLTYQWYIGDSGDTGTPISLGDNSTAQSPELGLGGPGTPGDKYWVRVTGDTGTADSDTVEIP